MFLSPLSDWVLWWLEHIFPIGCGTFGCSLLGYGMLAIVLGVLFLLLGVVVLLIGKWQTLEEEYVG